MNTNNISKTYAAHLEKLISTDSKPYYGQQCADNMSDMGDSSMKLNVDPVKVVKGAAMKISNKILEEYSEYTKHMGKAEHLSLHDLSFPICNTCVCQKNPPLLTSIVFLASSLSIVLFMRYRIKYHTIYTISDKSSKNNTLEETSGMPRINSDESIEEILENTQYDTSIANNAFRLWNPFWC